MATMEKPQVAGALVDLTRMLYFGPVVLSFFVLGVMLAMPDAPMWSGLVRVLLAGAIGFAGGFVLNDWAGWRADKVMLAARAHEAEYLAQLHRERRFTGTRPIAAGIVSPAAGLAFGLGLMAVSGAICLTFPSPNRWYLAGHPRLQRRGRARLLLHQGEAEALSHRHLLPRSDGGPLPRGGLPGHPPAGPDAPGHVRGHLLLGGRLQPDVRHD